MSRRKNPRHPARLRALRTRLNKLPAKRPRLSVATLWHLQVAGLRHLIPRDPTLAERWLGMIERALLLEYSGTLLTLGPKLWETRAQQLHHELEGFARLDFHQGKPKSGENWQLVEDDVTFIGSEVEELKQRAPEGAPLNWWAPRLNRLWRVWLRQPSPLSSIDITNVVVSRTTRAQALYLIARSRQADPARLAENLKRWRKRSMATA
jgi:hypothetical protein